MGGSHLYALPFLFLVNPFVLSALSTTPPLPALDRAPHAPPPLDTTVPAHLED